MVLFGLIAPTLLETAGILAVQTRDGLAFRPYADVALAMDEYEGRLTVVFSDGRVAHGPGPLESLPVPGLVRVDEGVLAAPRHGKKRGSLVRFPGGWTFPATNLPRSRTAPTLTSSVTVKIGKTDVDLSLLRSFEAEMTGYRLAFEDGATLFIHHRAATDFVARIGLDALGHLEPMSDRHRAMYRLGLRDFPYVLLTVATPVLKSVFGADERMCIANLIWEAARHRARGKPLEYGIEYRGFYYRPVLPVLHRLGLMKVLPSAALAGNGDDLPPDARPDELDLLAATDPILANMNDPHYLLYGSILSDMIGRDRLLTLHDLGFEDQLPHLRTVGTTHPDWLVVAEKASLLQETRTLGTTFGVSTIVLGGMARWEATEPMARQLRPLLGQRRLKLVSYGDYDPGGWEIVDVFAQQLARYDVATDIRGRLVLPHRFDARELDLVAEPIVATGSNATKLEKWMARTQGVNGLPLRIHADHLRPVERVIKAFKEETKLREVPS